MAKRTYGLIRQTYDPRDRKFAVHPRVAATLPPSLDLSANYFGKVAQRDQGRLGSCGPNTSDECIDCDWVADQGKNERSSRLFIYYNVRAMNGTISQDAGVDNRTMMKALATYGACPESMWPYDDTPANELTNIFPANAKARQKPTADCYSAALANKIIGYYAVQVALDQIKGALLQQQRPIVFGFDVFQGIESDQAATTGIVPNPGPRETPIGGHDVSLCGWDDATQRFKFRNHWMNGPGQPWGDNGYGYLSYSYATSIHVSDLWTIDAVQASQPTPPPAPTPTPAPAPGWHIHCPALPTDVYKASIGVGPN